MILAVVNNVTIQAAVCLTRRKPHSLLVVRAPGVESEGVLGVLHATLYQLTRVTTIAIIYFHRNTLSRPLRTPIVYLPGPPSALLCYLQMSISRARTHGLLCVCISPLPSHLGRTSTTTSASTPPSPCPPSPSLPSLSPRASAPITWE